MTIARLTENVDQSDLNEAGFEVANLVATINLEQEFDLRKLASDLPAAEYHPERFPFLVYQPEQLNPTILLPANGTVSFSGAKSKNQLVESTEILLSNLAKLGIQIEVGVDRLEVQNVVVTGDINTELDLAALTVGLGTENCEYEPEQFPGVFYRKPNLPLILLFNSGKIVVTGAKSYDEALEAGEHISKKITALFENG